MKGVITIAGYGTRFLPASKAVPKELFPVAGIPLIQHHVEALVAAGIREIIIVVRESGDLVQRHFASDLALEAHLEATGKTGLLEEVRRLSSMADVVIVRQPDRLPYGNASPVLAVRPWLTPGEPFYYMFGDDIILAERPVPLQMCEAFERLGRPAALLATQQVPMEETHLYGCLAFKPGMEWEMAGIVEKPEPGEAPSNWVQVGHFIFTEAIFSVLHGDEVGKGGELWLADAVHRLAQRERVCTHPIDGQWMAAGDPLRHLKANIVAALRREDMRPALVEFLRSLDLV